MKDLVQELRELCEEATDFCTFSEHFAGINKPDCKNGRCYDCMTQTFEAIADRIEIEYSPKHDSNQKRTESK